MVSIEKTHRTCVVSQGGAPQALGVQSGCAASAPSSRAERRKRSDEGHPSLFRYSRAESIL